MCLSESELGVGFLLNGELKADFKAMEVMKLM